MIKRTVEQILRFIKKSIKFIINEHTSNNSFMEKSIIENIKRIFYVSLIQILLHIGIVTLFIRNLFFSGAIDLHWQIHIIQTHLVFMVIACLVCMYAYYAKRNKYKEPSLLLAQSVYFISLLLLGVILAGIDQMVSTNITPFIIGTLSVGVFFIIRPLHSIIMYLTTYIVYAYAITLTTQSATVVATNYANGLGMIFIGFAVSLIGWNNHCTNIEQQNEIDRQSAVLQKMAYFDPLTGMPNRRFFDMALEKELATLVDSNEASLAILDVDHFKHINDNYGHPAGDEVLRQMATIISENIRSSDTIARLGGEEFIILFSNTPVEQGYLIADDLRQLIMNHEFKVDDKIIKVTASFGVSRLELSSEKGKYYANADQALYLAKKNGRNQVRKHKVK